MNVLSCLYAAVGKVYENWSWFAKSLCRGVVVVRDDESLDEAVQSTGGPLVVTVLCYPVWLWSLGRRRTAVRVLLRVASRYPCRIQPQRHTLRGTLATGGIFYRLTYHLERAVNDLIT